MSRKRSGGWWHAAAALTLTSKGDRQEDSREQQAAFHVEWTAGDLDSEESRRRQSIRELLSLISSLSGRQHFRRRHSKVPLFRCIITHDRGQTATDLCALFTLIILYCIQSLIVQL